MSLVCAEARPLAALKAMTPLPVVKSSLALGKFAIGSAYGAAGSLVVVIVWVYYSSLVFLFGAEFTRIVECDNRGEPIEGL